MKRRILALLALSATAVALTGCASTSTPSVVVAATASSAATATPTPVPTPEPTPVPTPVPTPTPYPTPGPSPKALCSNGDGEFPPKVCKLPPGTYSAAPFVPVFRFTLDAGWTNSLAGINAGQLSKGKPRATLFGWSTGMITEDGTDIGKTTDSLLGFFASRPDITVSAPTAVTIGGMPARSIDFTLSKGEIFMRVGKSGGGFQTGEKVRAIVVDVNGAVVLLAIEALDPKDFDAEIAAVQPILDSIVWN